jgi:hypothetical protein
MVVGLVIVGAIVIIVPLIASFALDTISLLESVFNLVVCISVVNDIVQVSILILAALNWRCYAVGQVLMWALVVARVLTPPPLLSTRSRVGSTIVATSSIAWRRLTCAFTSTLSLGSKGVSWSTIILEAKVLCAGVQ